MPLIAEIEPLPCPFCGSTNVSVQEGSTFRWVFAVCVECDARAGEVRRNTHVPPTESWPAAEKAAIAEWNRRCPAAHTDKALKRDAEIDALTAKGREAWADVPDASKWVDEQRGD